MKLFIDADFIVYKATAAAETEIDFGDDVIVVTSRFTDALNATVHNQYQQLLQLQRQKE